MKYMKSIFKSLWRCILVVMLAISTIGATYADSVDAQVRVYKPGDLMKLPMRKGNYVMLLWGNEPLWYDERDEWFHDVPVRNYSTITLQIPRNVVEGDYQFIEVDAVDDPRVLSNWRWVRENKVRVSKCDGFTLC